MAFAFGSGGQRPLFDGQKTFSPQTNIFTPSSVSKTTENNSIFNTANTNVFEPSRPQGFSIPNNTGTTFNSPLTPSMNSLSHQVLKASPSPNFSSISTSQSPFSTTNPFTPNVQPSFTTKSKTSMAPARSTWTHSTRNTFASPSNAFVGTRVQHYTATRSYEPGATSSTKVLSISAMPVYKEKSHEELRFEDCELFKKGGQNILGDTSSNPQPFSTQTSISYPPISKSPGNSSTYPLNTNVFAPKSSPFSIPDDKQTLTSLQHSDSSSNPYATNVLPFVTPNNSTFPPLVNTPFSSPSSASISPFSTTSTPTTTPAPSTNPFSSANFLFPSQRTVAPSNSGSPFCTTSTPTMTPAPSTNPFSSTNFLFPSQSMVAPSSSVSSFKTTSTHPMTPAPSTNPFASAKFLLPSQSTVAPSTSVSSFRTTSTPTMTPAPSTKPFSSANLVFPSTSVSPISTTGTPTITPVLSIDPFPPVNFVSPSQTNVTPFFSTYTFHPPTVRASSTFTAVSPCQPSQEDPSGLQMTKDVGISGINVQQSPSTEAIQPSVVSDPFGPRVVSDPFGPQSAVDISTSLSNSQPSITYGISAMPVSNHPSPHKSVPPLRIRHVSLRHSSMSAQRQSAESKKTKVPFFNDKGDAPITVSPFQPRENPRAWVTMTLSSRQGPESPSPLKYENGKACENKNASGTSSFQVKVSSTDDSLIKEKEFPLQENSQEAGDKSKERRDAEILALMPKLVHGGDYYTEPSIEELTTKEKSEPGYCSRVKDFILGRKDYGSIKFFGETDVRNLDLNSIVQFNSREVIVYPDDQKKPPVGQSLNKPAEVTLLNIKQTGNHNVDGPQAQSFKEKLNKLCLDSGAEFVSFDPVLGVWKFRVEHF